MHEAFKMTKYVWVIDCEWEERKVINGYWKESRYPTSIHKYEVIKETPKRFHLKTTYGTYILDKSSETISVTEEDALALFCRLKREQIDHLSKELAECQGQLANPSIVDDNKDNRN